MSQNIMNLIHVALCFWRFFLRIRFVFFIREEMKNSVIDLLEVLFGRLKHNKTTSNLNWVRSPLTLNGEIIAEPLVPEDLSDSDLPRLCFWMHLICDTIEYGRCEGRLISMDIFDPLDNLMDIVRFQNDYTLSDWIPFMIKFGMHYGLDGATPINIAPEIASENFKIFENFTL
jgi:hypothetical protein